MYIEPNSTIRLMKNVKLSYNDNHTLYFNSVAEQNTYFAGKTTKILNECSYVKNNQIKIESTMRDVYNIDYLSFTNSSFENKIFYAFVTDVEYINNETVLITYEIDDIQTWFFQFDLETCFVEREHVASDSRTAYLQPEPISAGDTIVRDLKPTGWLGGTNIAVIATKDAEFLKPFNGKITGNVYSCYDILTFSDADSINTLLNSLGVTDKLQDKIIAIYAVPKYITGGGGFGATDALPRPTTVDGYAPKNLKVLSSLYNNCFVTNGQGSSIVLDYAKTDRYHVYMTAAAGVPEAIFYPISYAGSEYGVNNKLSINNFPQCPITTTGFQEWLARQASKLLTIGAGVAGATGNIMLAAGLGLGASAVNSMGETQRYTSGSPTSTADWSDQILDFYIGQICIKYSNAKSLDDFFERYGYAINLVKKPNRTSRPEWNYVKTRDCYVTGDLPSDAAARIEQMHNNGITYWHNPANYKVYTNDNHKKVGVI